MRSRFAALSRVVGNWLRTGICLVLMTSPLGAAERLELEIHEAGGFRRHEPSSVLLTLPQPVARETPFRMLVDGAPVAAQFRPDGDDPRVARWWVDFSMILSPHAVRTAVVEYGQDVQPVPEGTHGHVLTENPDTFVIENAPYISWTVPRDLRGFLHSVNFPPSEHLRPQSPGLVARDRSGGRHPLGGPGTKVRVVRHGRRAVALRFTGGFDAGALAGVRWTADLLFPSPVSWVDLTCTLDDPQERVAGLGVELNMALDPSTSDAPTLVDFGAWTFVYAALAPDDVAELRWSPAANDRGGVFRGKPGQLLPAALSPAQHPDAGKTPATAVPPEGWLHVMDRRRCLALAVDRFAVDTEDLLSVTGDGAVGVWRDFAAPDAAAKRPEKSLRAWYHFVHFPPQYSAATSPRMMQTPSRVVVKPR